MAKRDVDRDVGRETSEFLSASALASTVKAPNSTSHEMATEASEPLLSSDDPVDASREVHRPRPQRKAAIGALLAVLLCVNLAASLYQLPLNRVVERRLCSEYYAATDPSRIGKDGNVPEQLCKVDQVQQGLGRIQGIMDTIWIVGGMPSPGIAPLMIRIKTYTRLRLRHDHTVELRGREVRAADSTALEPRAQDLPPDMGCRRRVF